MPHRLQALVYVEQLRFMLNAIKQFDVEIESIAKQHEDYALFTALPGAGPSLAPRLLVASGEQRERYKSAADLQKYSGVAPVTERSGKNTGCIGAGNALHLCDKCLLNGQRRPSINLIGRVSFIGSNEPGGTPIRRRCVPLHLNGYAFFIVVGKHEHHMMRWFILKPWSEEVLHCLQKLK